MRQVVLPPVLAPRRRAGPHRSVCHRRCVDTVTTESLFGSRSFVADREDCCSANLSNFEDIVVEGNSVIVKRGNGTCEKNGYSFGARHTIDRNNSCSLGGA